MSLQEIKDLIPTLSHSERKQLLELLVDTFVESAEQTLSRRRNLRELRGLGRRLWQGIDAQQYIDQQRDEWDER